MAAFYYSTNAAMLTQGGVSLFNSARSGINAFRAFKANPFSLNQGYGVFGQNGLKLSNYTFNSLYANARGGGGTIFSLKQMKQNGNLFRLDYGLIHKTGNMGLHTTVRFTFNGFKYGSSAQRRWYPTTVKPPFFEPF